MIDYLIKFVDVCVGLYLIEYFFIECRYRVLQNILIIILFSIGIVYIEFMGLYLISLIVYILFLYIVDREFHFQCLFYVTLFKVIDKISLEIPVLVFLYLSHSYYQDILNHVFLMSLFHILSKAIVFLIFNKLSHRLVKLQYLSSNKLHQFIIVFNVFIILTFQFIDINLLSYNKESFSHAFLLYMLLIVVYVFSISYFYQIYLNYEIKESLKFYNFQYKYLEEIYSLQKRYLKQNHDMKAMLYRYIGNDDIKALMQMENFQMIDTGNHTIDIVCNYYLNKNNVNVIIDIKKEILIDEVILMKLLDMLFSNLTDETMEIYCEDMLVIRILGQCYPVTSQLENFTKIHDFILMKSDEMLCITKKNRS